MNLLNINNLPCLPALTLGAIAVKKSYQDYKRDSKFNGTLKMLLGASFAAAGIALVAYNLTPERVRPLTECDSGLQSLHPGCSKLIDFTRNILQNGTFQDIGSKTVVSPLKENMDSINGINCSLVEKYNDTLLCFLKMMPSSHVDFLALKWNPSESEVKVLQAIPGCKGFSSLYFLPE